MAFILQCNMGESEPVNNLQQSRPNNTATFSRKEGLISLRRPEGSLDGDSGDVSLFFRTPFSRGILFHQGEIAGDFIQVNITSNDTVQLSYDIGNGPEAIVVKSSSPLNTNRLWHKVVVWFNIKEFGLEIDGVTKAKFNPLQKDSQLDAVGDLFIGGYGGAIQGWMPELLNGFIGCIRGFTINGEVLNLARLSKDFHYVSAGCNCTNETRCGDVFDTPPYTPDPSSGSTSLPPGPPRGPAARSGGDDDNYTVIIVVVVLLVILLIVAAILVFIWCSRKHRGLYHTHEDEPLAKTNEPFISLQPHGKDAAEPKKEWYI
ncbi:predicted protein [Nematostella vectensis]|uniref:Laminin G domain-containing protein n=1 Tax=Nematostella vectensis TaxID=45351 RepID=A7SHM6_NEMVE|nr:predicted protein [Nematostella vectensis]|eukprot:XP_001628871.1 predicted protein [Nematostella vectensis]